jgi:hypothetical protein
MCQPDEIRLETSAISAVSGDDIRPESADKTLIDAINH